MAHQRAVHGLVAAPACCSTMARVQTLSGAASCARVQQTSCAAPPPCLCAPWRAHETKCSSCCGQVEVYHSPCFKAPHPDRGLMTEAAYPAGLAGLVCVCTHLQVLQALCPAGLVVLHTPSHAACLPLPACSSLLQPAQSHAYNSSVALWAPHTVGNSHCGQLIRCTVGTLPTTQVEILAAWHGCAALRTHRRTAETHIAARVRAARLHAVLQLWRLEVRVSAAAHARVWRRLREWLLVWDTWAKQRRRLARLAVCVAARWQQVRRRVVFHLLVHFWAGTYERMRTHACTTHARAPTHTHSRVRTNAHI